MTVTKREGAEPGVAYVVSGLSKVYRAKSGDVTATDNIDLEVRRGEVFGLLGPNGAGKTSLVRQLIGLLRPDAGRIELFGRDVVAAARDAVIDELGLGGFANRPIAKLSGGQRRLAGVGAALVGDRPVLVLDEPTTGLDTTARRAVWNAIERRRSQFATTVILVTHNVLEAETVLDRVAILERGRVIASDTPGRWKALVDRDVRLELAWRHDPPDADQLVQS